MSARLLLNLTTALALVAGQGAFAAVGKILAEPFKNIESKHAAIEKVIKQRANFEALKAREGTVAHELGKSIEEVSKIHEKASANDIKVFALRGTKEAKIVKLLASADRVLKAKDQEGGLSDVDRKELTELQAAVKASSGFVSSMGRHLVLGLRSEKSIEDLQKTFEAPEKRTGESTEAYNVRVANEKSISEASNALGKLAMILPKIISEFTKEERQGYIKLLNEMTEELNRRDNTELPAEILRKKLGVERMKQLMDCII